MFWYSFTAFESEMFWVVKLKDGNQNCEEFCKSIEKWVLAKNKNKWINKSVLASYSVFILYFTHFICKCLLPCAAPQLFKVFLFFCITMRFETCHQSGCVWYSITVQWGSRAHSSLEPNCPLSTLQRQPVSELEQWHDLNLFSHRIR